MCRVPSTARSGKPARPVPPDCRRRGGRTRCSRRRGAPRSAPKASASTKTGGSILFVANTGNDTIVQIPVSGGTPGTPAIFTNSINGADGLILDDQDNLWVCANQSDEIVVVDPTGKVIAKLGDFDGLVDGGTPNGLLFPASPGFSPDKKTVYVTNLGLDLRVGTGNPANIAVDSASAAQVKPWTVSKIKPQFQPLPNK